MIKFKTSRRVESSSSQVHRRRAAPMVARLAVCLIVVVVTAGGLQAIPAQARNHLQQDLPIVRCEPPHAQALVGQTVTVDLYVQNIEPPYTDKSLFGVDLHLAGWDTTIAQETDGLVTPVADLLTPPWFWVLQSADNTTGLIMISGTQLDLPSVPNPGKLGSGAVGRLQFTGIQAGTFTMQFTNHQLSSPDLTYIPNDAQDCQVTFEIPTAYELASFTATAGPGRVVTLDWETATEVGSVGYNIYRSETLEGEQQRLNGALIPTAKPGSPTGAVYEYIDATAVPGTTYFYWLEVVHDIGPHSVFGPEQATAGRYTIFIPFFEK